MTVITELHKEKVRLEEYLEWGKNILHFDELNKVRAKIKELQSEIDSQKKINKE